jgi:hypothetical protein
MFTKITRWIAFIDVIFIVAMIRVIMKIKRFFTSGGIVMRNNMVFVLVKNEIKGATY